MKAKEHKSTMIGYSGVRALLGCPIGTIYSLVSKKKIPHYRMGPRHVLFNTQEVNSWLDQHKVTVGGGK